MIRSPVRFDVQRSKKNRWLVSKKNSIASCFTRVTLSACSRMSERAVRGARANRVELAEGRANET